MLVDHPIVEESKFLRPKEFYVRPYALPFFPLYATFYHIYKNSYDEYIKGPEWTFVYLGTIICLNILFVLMPEWSVKIDSAFNYYSASSLAQATHVMIATKPNNGASQIVKIDRTKLPNQKYQVSLSFQKLRFLFDGTKFSSPTFTIDREPTIGFYQQHRGLSGDLDNDRRLYGSNSFDIPIPSFMELFKEHAVAPFFVFQIFCVGLWLLDEFWYYSLFTLFMLVSFEIASVYQARTTMAEFRTMSIKPYAIQVFRDGKWAEMMTDELLPDDLVSIQRTSDESAIPCDLILLDGTAIVNEAMLSGESTPLLKESIKLRPAAEKLDLEGLDKNAVLHGGTKALQVTAGGNTPDGGALAVVTKTGFETSQGSLVRVMIFSSEKVSVGNMESMFFLLFLLIFAIAASWYVWVEGTRMGRIHSKLILDCILIITSVVPPELPMELTMAVNNSLSALSKFYIYCTEPFRIPLAGRIDVCCFDKTGTITESDMNFEGLAGLTEDTKQLINPTDASEITQFVLGSAHALVKLDDGEVVGDPMEISTLKAAQWKVGDKDHVSGPLGKIEVLRRFQFSSALKRSASVSRVANNKQLLVSVKGAPEVIRARLINVPSNYEDVYKSFTRAGSRVLALGYKQIENKNVDKLERENVESGLDFAGFLVFHCPLKPDAIESIKMLNESSHRCVMITGDNPLTAVHVAKEVAIVERETLILDEIDGKLSWTNVDETISLPCDPSAIDAKLFAQYDIAVTGVALAQVTDEEQMKKLIRHTWVYARVSPSQKENILTTLKDMGYQTLMCGDGTNDVGALKQAHVGIALLNGTEEGMVKMAEQRKLEVAMSVYDKQTELFKRWNRPPGPVPKNIAHMYPPGPSNPHYLKAMEEKGITVTPEMAKLAFEATTQAVESSQDELASKIMGSLSEMEGEQEAPKLKLGDASCAAPFTSKLASVSAVTNIVRQGRCALINTIQMYKILALNCLISAYSLSVIYLAGVKFGDGQQTISGLMLSVCFMSISRGKPLQKLSKERPQPGIFNIYIMGSILGQFAIHMFTLIYVTMEIYKLEPREPQVDLEKKFVPSLLNTGIFLIQLAQQVSTFAVNYQGHPFRESISSNRGMYWGLLGVAGMALAGSTEFFPEINEAMQFVPMEDDFKFKLTGMLCLDFFGSFAVEHFFKFFFMDSKAADIAIRD